MNAGNDMTPKQVAAWVAQEAAKHATAVSRAARVKSERQFIAMAADMGLDRTMPNAMAARRKAAASWIMSCIAS